MYHPTPLAGPSSFLERDPYQNVLSVDQPGSNSEAYDESAIDDAGETSYGQFGNPQFSQAEFAQGAQTTVQDEAIRRRGAADLTHHEEWDLDDLEKEDLDVQAFVKRTIKTTDQEGMARLKSALMRSKQVNAKDLQRNVFKQCVVCT